MSPLLAEALLTMMTAVEKSHFLWGGSYLARVPGDGPSTQCS